MLTFCSITSFNQKASGHFETYSRQSKYKASIRDNVYYKCTGKGRNVYISSTTSHMAGIEREVSITCDRHEPESMPHNDDASSQ